MYTVRTELTTYSMTSDLRRSDCSTRKERSGHHHNERPEAIKTKATTALRYIRQSFMSITKASFSILYNTCVHPHMDKDIEVSERIQRRATKLVRGLSDLPYEVLSGWICLAWKPEEKRQSLRLHRSSQDVQKARLYQGREILQSEQ